MIFFLLDTNVISEASKPRPNAEVLGFLYSRPVETFFLSTVSLAEIDHGADTVDDPVRRADLKRWLAFDVRPMFGNRVYEVTEQVILRWIALVQWGRKVSRTFAQPDLFLAATALEHNLTLVTRNTKDFASIPDLVLLNPWETTV